MLQLLAQAALIIHRRHFQQNKAFRQPLGGQRQDVRTAIDNQRHFVIGKPSPACRLSCISPIFNEK